ncbi:MAG: hypothetical protein V7K25_15875 [Nostoc sp.]|uniref:hypothetical protein n=1 Tax=Nostoc sp. TaxID=1180 RepID=UPI002FF44388
MFGWNPEAEVQVGDTLVYIDVAYDLALSEQHRKSHNQRWQWQQFVQGITAKNLKDKIAQFWQSYYQSQNQIRRIATIYAITVLILWLVGIVLYRLYYPHITLQEAFYATGVLLLEGYGDLFGGVEFSSQSEPSDQMPWWLRLFSLGLTLIGQAFVGVLYALLTDALVTSTIPFFQFSSSNTTTQPCGDYWLKSLGTESGFVSLERANSHGDGIQNSRGRYSQWVAFI